MKTYLSKKELSSLVEVIQQAEKQSTGEMRIHLDNSSKKNFEAHAMHIFEKLEMHKTADRNAVLFYISFDKHHISIIGDKAIHEKVTQTFWDKLLRETTTGFAQKDYFSALQNAIEKTAIELKKHFPSHNGNTNELSNEITFS